ncbi:MAG: Slp family lipoprotein [Wenzhouxiangellaceae bacterium]|nr:Slp family lipoprotein [Wenzhouxiangellaceae bacterium]
MFTQRSLAALTVVSLVLTGCATVPEPIQGERYSQNFFPDQAIERSLGTPVRWGGVIVDTRPQADRTCIEVLAQELDSRAYPKRSDDDFGRFVVCDPAFLDPEIYTNGRYITAVGTLEQFQIGQIGEFDYRYPVVKADAVYLWPERDDVDYAPYYGRGFYYPYYGYGYPYYFGYSRYPYSRGGFHGRVHSSGGETKSSGTSSTK